MRQIRQRLPLDISQNAGIDIGRSYLVVEAVQRLEQLCKPGSVVVQGAVSERVPIRLPIAFGNLGERSNGWSPGRVWPVLPVPTGHKGTVLAIRVVRRPGEHAVNSPAVRLPGVGISILNILSF